MYSNKKIIIFDFDETLYSHPKALDFYVDFIKNAILANSNKTEKQAMEIIHKYGFDKKGEARVSFGKTCEEFGVKKVDWNNYKKTHFFEVDYATAQVVKNEFLIKLSKKYRIYLLSNELLENIVYKAQKLGINLDCFHKIFAPSIKNGPSAIVKKEVYKKIIESENVESNEILAIGDRYQVDIAPLVELGGEGIQVSTADELNNLLEKLLLEHKTLKVNKKAKTLVS